MDDQLISPKECLRMKSMEKIPCDNIIPVTHLESCHLQIGSLVENLLQFSQLLLKVTQFADSKDD